MRVEFEIRPPRWWRQWRTRRLYKKHSAPPGTNDFQVFHSTFDNIRQVGTDEVHDMTQEYDKYGDEFKRIAKENP